MLMLFFQNIVFDKVISPLSFRKIQNCLCDDNTSLAKRILIHVLLIFYISHKDMLVLKKFIFQPRSEINTCISN